MAFATYVSEKSVSWIRWILLLVFGVLAMSFSMFLFWNFPKQSVLKWFYAALGVIWELGNIYFAIRLKTAVTTKKPWLGWLLGYIIFVSVSIGGGVGFNLATTGSQAKAQVAAKTADTNASASSVTMRTALQKKVDSANATSARYEKMLATVDDTNPDNAAKIASLTKSRDQADTAASAAAKDLKAFDDAERAAKNEAAGLSAAPVAQATKDPKAVAAPSIIDQDIDVFGALGEMLGNASADSARKWFFLVIVVVIQIIVLISSPLISETSLGEGNNRNLMRFIDALFDGAVGKKLNPPWKVAKRMGLSSQERDRYISLLSTMIYRSEPIVRQSHGRWLTPFDLVSFKKIVSWEIAHPSTVEEEEESVEEIDGEGEGDAVRG